jgi:hypothetical protein
MFKPTSIEALKTKLYGGFISELKDDDDQTTAYS